MRTTCVALLFLFAAGCGCPSGDSTNGPDVVARLGEHHTLAAPVTVGNLTVWPVRTDRPLDLGEFLTLEEALAKDSAEVREVGAPQGSAPQADHNEAQGEEPTPDGARAQGDGAGRAGVPPALLPSEEIRTEPTPAREAGQAPLGQQAFQTAGQEEQTLTQVLQSLDGAVVNTLVIENKGDLPILVCAGTVVKGGNQDRQIGQDFVIKARSETPVDAFCVEQGRWQQERMGTDTQGKFQVLDGMATAKVRARGQYEKDQGGVWQEVAIHNQSFRDDPRFHESPENAPSAAAFGVTSFAVAFDANAEASKEELRRCEDAVKARFAADDGAVGFAYAINGKPVAVRTFAHPRLLSKHIDSFVRGMATEALLAKDEPKKPADAKDVVTLVAKISASDETVAETRALNKNGVRLHEKGYNANCYVADKEGNLLPITQDWTAK